MLAFLLKTVLALFKAVGEPCLEMLSFIFHLQKPELNKSPKPALKHPNQHWKDKNIQNIKAGT